MDLEAILLQAGWLAGTITDAGSVARGVNAMLPGVPRWSGHAQPPDVAVVENEVEHPNIARSRVPTASPGLAVILYREFDADPIPPTVSTDWELELATIYTVREVNTEKAIRDGMYTRRAIVRSLREFARNANVAKRQVGAPTPHTSLVQLMGIRVVPTFEQLEDVVVTAAVISRWKGRDHAPMG